MPCYRIFSLVLTVEACDERSIPEVDHATYEIYHHRYSGDVIPEQDFSLPGRTDVTYTCDRGYYLEHPKNKKIGAKWDFGHRRWTNQQLMRCEWKSAEGINCKKGKTQSY